MTGTVAPGNGYMYMNVQQRQSYQHQPRVCILSCTCSRSASVYTATCRSMYTDHLLVAKGEGCLLRLLIGCWAGMALPCLRTDLANRMNRRQGRASSIRLINRSKSKKKVSRPGVSPAVPVGSARYLRQQSLHNAHPSLTVMLQRLLSALLRQQPINNPQTPAFLRALVLRALPDPSPARIPSRPCSARLARRHRRQQKTVPRSCRSENRQTSRQRRTRSPSQLS